MSRNNLKIFMFVCTTVLYEYMNLLRNDVYNLFVNTHVWIKIYQEFCNDIIYIAKEGHHIWWNIFKNCVYIYVKYCKAALSNVYSLCVYKKNVSSFYLVLIFVFIHPIYLLQTCTKSTDLLTWSLSFIFVLYID